MKFRVNLFIYIYIVDFHFSIREASCLNKKTKNMNINKFIYKLTFSSIPSPIRKPHLFRHTHNKLFKILYSEKNTEKLSEVAFALKKTIYADAAI